MGTRLKVIVLIVAALVVAAFAVKHLAELTQTASNKAHPSYANPPSRLATPPPGAQPGEWWLDTKLESERDGTPYTAAGTLILAALLQVVAPREQKRIRTSVLCFLLYLATLPLAGALVSFELLDWYGDVRLVALLSQAITAINLIAIFVFDIVFVLASVKSPVILRDIIIASAYVGALLSLFSRAGVNLSGIVATSAVITAVIGFSLQDTLGNIMGGLALQWEDSIGVGDWVKVGDVTGKVKEIHWRQTTIETRNWDTAVVPNSVLMKGQVIVLGRRIGEPAQHRQWVYFQVAFDVAPTDVIAAVNEALQAAPIERVAVNPKPHCILYDFKEYAAYYAVRYWLTDLAVDDPTDSVVRTRVYFALSRAGISLALPERQIHQVKDKNERAEREVKLRAEKLAALARVTLFGMLTQDELETLVPHLRYAPFTQGEVMTRQGAAAHWLYLIIRGKARVEVKRDDGELKHVAALKDGDVFGEMALLTGEARTASVIAETDVECWRLDAIGFKDVLTRRPEIATELSRILAERRVTLAAVRDGQDDDQAKSKRLENAENELLSKITQFFGL